MTAADLVHSLLAAGQAGDYAAVLALPGADVHAKVLRFSDSLRGALLDEVAQLSAAERVAFAKALAIYENTVDGLGSVTAIERVLSLVDDEEHAVLDWVLTNTRSYWYYSHGAKSFTELQTIQRAHAARRAENEQREHERETIAKSQRAERATANLLNAIRRGDAKAVAALLLQGASRAGTTPAGLSFAEYAENCGHSDIAALLRRQPGTDSAV